MSEKNTQSEAASDDDCPVNLTDRAREMKKAMNVAKRLADLQQQVEDLTRDRDEWRQQHENLLFVRQQDIAALATQQAVQGKLAGFLHKSDPSRFILASVHADFMREPGANRSVAEQYTQAVYTATPPAPQQPEALAQQERETQAARDVLAERQRQISVEGWTPAHDDEHHKGDLSAAAACYATTFDAAHPMPADWPWSEEWWKPSEHRRNLIKAGALILAEIERLDRAARSSEGGQS